MPKKKRILSKYDGRKYGWFHFALEFVIGIIICLLVASFIVGFSRVDGESMSPTLENNEMVLYLRVANDYNHNDVVAIKMPSGDKYVKRIIAVEGDTVDIRDGKVYVNDAYIDEPYAEGETVVQNNKIKYPLTVKEDQVFVLGDNREVSVDSRSFGPVILENLKGTLIGYDFD